MRNTCIRFHDAKCAVRNAADAAKRRRMLAARKQRIAAIRALPPTEQGDFLLGYIFDVANHKPNKYTS